MEIASVRKSVALGVLATLVSVGLAERDMAKHIEESGGPHYFVADETSRLSATVVSNVSSQGNATTVTGTNGTNSTSEITPIGGSGAAFIGTAASGMNISNGSWQ
eukprot:TRINITY_DN1860_c0_g1_i1.p1 TRINITY_DN1860_c0_g1~~TRINITY_DN1860_c0_g1_i1.p1  ORF type:complete len:105 (+),score=17.31 TRINITY_DN1860_c0_g1_i1:92-406(+)